jgi:hypothetical protein
MKVKTSNLNDEALDWAVALIEKPGIVGVRPDGKLGAAGNLAFSPSRDFALGAPILSRERISRTIDHSGLWVAYWSDGYTEGDEGKQHMQCDRSELVAGLRCVVARKLGDEVEIPEELL